MTPEEINIKIAEACGFKRESWPGGIYWYNPDHALCSDGHVLNDASELPDYCGDLNAMAEAERVALIGCYLQNKYQANIAEITWGDDDRRDNQVVFNQLTATAAQRAEAFILTLESK